MIQTIEFLDNGLNITHLKFIKNNNFFLLKIINPVNYRKLKLLLKLILFLIINIYNFTIFDF